jgi:flagellin
VDVNNLNSVSNVGVNNIPKQYVDKARFNGSIDAVDNEDALKLSIHDVYNKKRDELSHSLKNLNEGIAVTQISMNSLSKQQENLKNIGTALVKLDNSGDYENKRFDTAEEISTQLNSYNQEAQKAKFNKKLLLDDQYGDEVINIMTSSKDFKITGVNTKAISQDLVNNLQSNALSSSEDVNSALGNVDEALNKSKAFSDNFSKMNSEMKQVARGTLNQQINLLKENSKLKDLNFGSDFNDFSKTNVMSQLGNLAASQAHIIQEQTSKLLA